MPGTPATSPRFGIARYADADTASFSAQVNAITDGFDAAAAKAPNMSVIVSNTVLSSAVGVDDYIRVPGGITATLPAPAAGMRFKIVADTGATGAGPATVAYGAGGGVIKGRGLGSGVGSIVLGTPGAYVELAAFDTSTWWIVGGEQDTGWVAIALGSNIGAVGSAYTPAARVRGDRVELCGVIVNNTGGTVAFGTQIATLPTAAEPTETLWDLPVSLSTGSAMGIEISGNAIKVNAPWSNGVGLGLDNVVYRLV